MTGTRANRLLRRSQDPLKASYLELFFDLAFIFALTRLTGRLLQDLSIAGALRTLVLLAGVWWIWNATAVSTDWFSPAEPAVQRLLIWVMLGSLLMATAVPKAFGSYATVFVGAYLAIHLGRAAILIPALRGHPLQTRSVRVVIWFGITGVLWVAGVAVATVRQPLWAVAIIIDLTIGLLGWPVPGLGRTAPNEGRVTGQHLSERYEQIFIVAIGELILVSGISLGAVDLGPSQAIAFVLSFVNAVMLARIYHARSRIHLGPAIDQSGDPTRLGLITGYLHLVLTAGILTTAAGNELIIGHADRPNRASFVVVPVAGLVLFLAGRILLTAVTNHRLSWPRLGGMLVVVAVAPAVLHLPPAAVPAIIDAVLIAVAVADRVIYRTFERAWSEPTTPTDEDDS